MYTSLIREQSTSFVSEAQTCQVLWSSSSKGSSLQCPLDRLHFKLSSPHCDLPWRLCLLWTSFMPQSCLLCWVIVIEQLFYCLHLVATIVYAYGNYRRDLNATNELSSNSLQVNEYYWRFLSFFLFLKMENYYRQLEALNRSHWLYFPKSRPTTVSD